MNVGHHATAARGSSDAVQNYTKAIWSLQQRESGEAVSTTALADRLGVSAGSASAMVKRLDELGLVEHEPYHGVRLSAGGREIALRVIRHHRLIELFLAEILGLPWDRVHAEAEVLEHHVSPEVAELMADKLGQPTRDPHGDPIPTRELVVADERIPALAALQPGDRGVFVRISDADGAMLRWLSQRGIALGDHLEVLDRQPFGGPLTVRVGEATEALGGALADAMRVRLDKPGTGRAGVSSP